MFQIYFIILTLAICNCFGKEENNNEITPLKSPIQLDTKLRKALLRALTELENEERKIEQEDLLLSDSPLYDADDKTVQKAPESSISVVTTSYLESEKNTITEATTEAKEKQTYKPIVVIQKSSGLQHKPITEFVLRKDNYHDPLNETIQTSASSSFNTNTIDRKESIDKNSPKSNFIQSDLKKSTPGKSSVTQKIEVTSPAPKITTSTEESEAKVEDVQFFSAPLVAAFTVHQDERGLPQSVVPIFKSNSNQASKIEERVRLQQEELVRKEKLKQEEFQRQLALQENQRHLEQQLFQLQRQTEQQQAYLLRQQQIFQEQQLKIQNQLLLSANNQNQPKSEIQNQPKSEFSNFLPTTTKIPFTPQNIFTTNHFAPTTIRPQTNNFNGNTGIIKAIYRPNVFRNPETSSTFNQDKVQSPTVSFQPSISFTPTQQQLQFQQQQQQQQFPHNQQQLNLQIQQQRLLPPINQQLPIKNPNDFTINPYYKPPSIQQLLTLTPPVRSSPVFQNTLQTPQLNLQSNDQQQSNRVFRHESGTSNFNNHNNNKQFNQHFHEEQQPTRFFRSNYQQSFSTNRFQAQPPVINHHLNTLLYQSGISKGPSNEDLNIVSKVLAFGVGGNDNHFSASTNAEQKVPSNKRKN